MPCSAVQCTQLRLPDPTGHVQALSPDRADLLPGPRLSRRGPGFRGASIRERREVLRVKRMVVVNDAIINHEVFINSN